MNETKMPRYVIDRETAMTQLATLRNEHKVRGKLPAELRDRMDLIMKCYDCGKYFQFPDVATLNAYIAGHIDAGHFSYQAGSEMGLYVQKRRATSL
jgi:hypothetical protein